jgi:hypothetical protein
MPKICPKEGWGSENNTPKSRSLSTLKKDEGLRSSLRTLNRHDAHTVIAGLGWMTQNSRPI